MSLTLVMTDLAVPRQNNDPISPDALNGSNDFWFGIAKEHGLIESGQNLNDVKIIVARGLTPEIAQAHPAQVWGLVHDNDRRVPAVLGQTLAKAEFSALPFVSAMRAKIAVLNAPALTV